MSGLPPFTRPSPPLRMGGADQHDGVYDSMLAVHRWMMTHAEPKVLVYNGGAPARPRAPLAPSPPGGRMRSHSPGPLVRHPPPDRDAQMSTRAATTCGPRRPSRSSAARSPRSGTWASGYEALSALLEDTALPSRLVAARAQAAPTHPGAQPEHLGRPSWSQELTSGRLKGEDLPLATARRGPTAARRAWASSSAGSSPSTRAASTSPRSTAPDT